MTWLSAASDAASRGFIFLLVFSAEPLFIDARVATQNRSLWAIVMFKLNICISIISCRVSFIYEVGCFSVLGILNSGLLIILLDSSGSESESTAASIRLAILE